MTDQLVDAPGRARTVTPVTTPDASPQHTSAPPARASDPSAIPDAGSSGGAGATRQAAAHDASADAKDAPPAASPTAEEKKRRGQFFTRHQRVHRIMVDLVAHTEGAAAEPSAGSGHLVAVLEQYRPDLTVDAVELDDRLEKVCETPITHGDFFTWARGRDSTYQVAFGNPPYVAWKDVEASTRESAATVKALYSDKTNLYHLFIDRCADLLAPGGELILIVPKEWLYTTSAAPLRTKLARNGALTHVVDCGEEKLFDDAAVPALLIFRWERGATQGPVTYASGTAAAEAGEWQTRLLRTRKDRWLLLPSDLAELTSDWGTLGEQYQVRVGLVTGADRAYKLKDPTSIPEEFVQWQLDTTRHLVPFLNANHIEDPEELPAAVLAHLAPHEATLRGRKIARFGDHNWWKYGAVRNETHMRSDAQRFFALAKTRSDRPFFTLEGARFYTGGVLGIFQLPPAKVSVATAVAILNSAAYRAVLEAMSLTSADKVSLQPATLADAPFPRTEADAAAFLAAPHTAPPAAESASGMPDAAAP